MDGNKSEAVFESMNLDPQLFINETINAVDELVDEAFVSFESEASALVTIDGSDGSKELSNGSDRVRGMIQSVLEKRLQMWEVYCLKFCFAVPQGLTLPGSDDKDQNIQDDLELDEQLDSLRHELTLVGKRSAELNSQLQALERTSVSTQHSARLVTEALSLYDGSSVGEGFNEMAKLVEKLRPGMDRLKRKRMEAAQAERLKDHGEEFLATTSDGMHDDLERFLAGVRKV